MLAGIRLWFWVRWLLLRVRLGLVQVPPPESTVVIITDSLYIPPDVDLERRPYHD